MSIEGKVAMVTGGSGGLGKVHALTLAKAGCNVVVTGHSHLEKAEEVVKQIQAMGRKALAVKMDVSVLEEVQAGVKLVEKELGPIEILVNNAAFGIVRAVTLPNMKNEDWDRDLAVCSFLKLLTPETHRLRTYTGRRDLRGRLELNDCRCWRGGWSNRCWLGGGRSAGRRRGLCGGRCRSGR